MDPRVFEAMLASFAEAIAIFDHERALLWVNPSAEQIFGVSSNRLAGRTADEIFAGAGSIIAEIGRVAAGGYAIFDHETRFINALGMEYPVSVSVHPLDADSGGGTAVFIRNLTGLKALERSVKLREKAEETAILAAGIAHEIKNPLSGIRGAAQLIQREPGGRSLEEYTGVIIRETDRINRLITDLIQLNNPAMFQMSTVNLHETLENMLVAQREELERRNIRLEKIYDPSLPPALGNADRLAQVFLNLFKNAMEASPDGGRMTLRTGPAWRLPDGAPPGKDKKYAVVEILDEGTGIDGADLPGLFTPFYTRKKGGSGLGLTVTLNIVTAHNGALTVRNRKDGKGAEAAVYLPFA